MNPLHLHSQTRDGRAVVTGLFQMHDQEGFPLSMSLAECHDRGALPSLVDIVASAHKAGWPRDKVERWLEAETSEHCPWPRMSVGVALAYEAIEMLGVDKVLEVCR